jgi:Ribonuclease G/E
MNKTLRRDLLKLLEKWNKIRGLPPRAGQAKFLRGAEDLIRRRVRRAGRAATAIAQSAGVLFVVCPW